MVSIKSRTRGPREPWRNNPSVRSPRRQGAAVLGPLTAALQAYQQHTTRSRVVVYRCTPLPEQCHETGNDQSACCLFDQVHPGSERTLRRIQRPRPPGAPPRARGAAPARAAASATGRTSCSAGRTARLHNDIVMPQPTVAPHPRQSCPGPLRACRHSSENTF